MRIESWQELYNIISKLERNEWIYRGQVSSKWKLQSSLHREIENFIKPSNNRGYVKIEQQMLKEYNRSSHLYSSYQVREPQQGTTDISEVINYTLERLSIMQHYGSPTRFLDWTYSPYIATFFALDGAVDEFTIYALNIKELEKYDVERFGLENYKHNQDRSFIDFSLPTNNFIFKYEPKQQNERIRKQQGLFIVPSVINKSIDDILLDYSITNGKLQNNNDVAIKLVFKKEVIKEFWNELRKMNITQETIYPGFEGFCKSLKLNIFN